MKWAILGILAGFVLNCFIPGDSMDLEMIPVSSLALRDVFEGPSVHKEISGSSPRMMLSEGPCAVVVSDDCGILSRFKIEKGIASASGNGEFIAVYEKAGKEISFYKNTGERYWSINSFEYPYLSYSGSMIVLMNGDHSRLRFIDKNANELGDGKITGRLCTAMAFSEKEDFFAAGFLDGSYYLVDPSGRVLASNNVPDRNIVKSIAVSPEGHYFAVHYGSTDRDFILVISPDDVLYNISLKKVHSSRIPIAVTDTGHCFFLDGDRIISIDSDGEVRFSLEVTQQKIGHGSLKVNAVGLIALTYTAIDGLGHFVLFSDDGIVYHRGCPGYESALDCFLFDSSILVRGRENLYCYKLRTPVDN